MFVNLNPLAIGLGAVGFVDLVELARRFGFEGIDFPHCGINTEDAAAEARDAVRAAGLRWGLFWLPGDFLDGTDDQFDEAMGRLDAVLPIIRRAGVTRTYNHVWPGSNERAFDENFAWHVARLKRLVERLGEAGVHLGIEFMGPRTLWDKFAHPFIRTLAGAVQLADAVGPGLGIVVDCFHLYTSDGAPADLSEQLSGRRVINVHANDAFPGRSRAEQLDGERAMPLTTGLIDTPGILAALDTLGYDGPVIAEPFYPSVEKFQQMSPADVLTRTGAHMRELFRRGGVQRG